MTHQHHYLLIRWYSVSFFFFFNDTATTEIYTLSLHDALPICAQRLPPLEGFDRRARGSLLGRRFASPTDRKSTRLNSSHLVISYAVFCLKKKKEIMQISIIHRQKENDQS